MAMRSLLLAHGLLEKLTESLGVTRDDKSKVCAIWEDNNAALTQANAAFPNMTPRSKSLAVKYHWFKEHLIEGEIEAKRIDTDLQKADIFTKGLARIEFEKKRRMIVGW